MSDKSNLDTIKLRGQRRWTLEVPIKIHNEREIVRRATREVDPPIRLSRPIDKFDIAVLILCVVSGTAFLALYYGLFDWIYELFR